jgi:glycopeptide antibiotics resistance protein
MELPTVFGRGWASLILVAFPLVVAAMRRRGRATGRRVTLVGLVFLYAAATVAVTIFPVHVAPESWRQNERWWDVLLLIPFVVPPVGNLLNIVMFVPFGVLLPLLWPATATVRRIAAWGLAASATIEFSQLGLWVAVGNRRMWDVNDLMANTTGAVFGLLLLRTFVPDAPALLTPARDSDGR